MGFNGFGFIYPGVVIDIEKEFDIFVGDVETCGVEIFDIWDITDRSLFGAGIVIGAVEDPFENADVFAVTWPDELSVFILAEPVDGIDLRKLVLVGHFAHVEPMLDVVADMIADEWQHCEWIAADLAEFVADDGGGDFAAHDRSEENTVLPVETFINEWDGGRAAAAEKDGVNWHTLRFFPFVFGDDRALAGWCREAGIWMGGAVVAVFVPVVALPVDKVIWCRRKAFPPDITIVGQCDIGEDGIL